MRVVTHPVLGLLMALVLALTGQAMAHARSMPGPSGMIELCTGTGPLMVAVDENGQPIGAPHICPDCTFGLFAATPVALDLPGRPLSRRADLRPGAGQVAAAAVPLATRARGPPLPV